MNIFFLSICIRRCAQYHFDSHVVKMILELCQLLSTSWHMLDADAAATHQSAGRIYRKTHFNHPCAIWTRAHVNNYKFVAKLALALCDEWRYRYQHPDDKQHACEPKLRFLLRNPPPSIPRFDIPRTVDNPKRFTFPMPQAMPDEYRIKPTLESAAACQSAYRRYYMSTHKYDLRCWSVTNPDYISDSKTPDEPKRIPLDRPHWFNVGDDTSV